jgi:hypothetical protein
MLQSGFRRAAGTAAAVATGERKAVSYFSVL